MQTATTLDADLRHDAEAELAWEPSIDARGIGVAVEDGVVTLMGHVKTYVEKWKAERAVERVKGVRGIANEIEVQLVGEHSDSDIARAAVDALRLSTLVPDDRIKVKVERGLLTLSGDVSYDYQRRAAERAVRNLPGVRGVTNLIVIKPSVEPMNVQEGIEKSFERLAVLDASNVQVSVDGGVVTLRGTVHSWRERHEAEKAAWSAGGVSEVRNLITVIS